MATIYVDGKTFDVPEDKDLLSTLLNLGFNIPYFCWHPALGSVGACRQCAVKIFRDESDKTGKIVMSCMTPVADGLLISVDDPEVKEFRKHVIEWMMLNHPHDCPICDEGGECHLQDMTVATGHVYRRYRGRKRTFRNQDLGPFVNHEMNRCIQCYRCVRFYKDYAGGRDFGAFASKDVVYFGRSKDGRLESEFSGNLVEICPTGVFTDKTFKRHYARKWDLQTAPSVCVHCGLGCNTLPGARDETLRRIRSRYNYDVNGYFLCDRGRFGYEFVNDPRRIRQPLAGKNALQSISWEAAFQQAKEMLQSCKRVVGIGSSRASLEANFALKTLVGEEYFSTGMSAAEQAGLQLAVRILRDGQLRSPSLLEVESADVILILGTNPTNEAPMLDLAIRRALHKAALGKADKLQIPRWNDYAVRDALSGEQGSLYIAAPATLKLEEIASGVLHISPPQLVKLAWDIEKVLQGHVAYKMAAAAQIAAALAAAKQPLLIVSAIDNELLKAAANIAQMLSERKKQLCLLSIVVPECNSVGAALLGGMNLDEALEEIEAGEADGMIVLENDLFRHISPDKVNRALAKLRHLIVLEHTPNGTTAAADLVLPAATFAESMGTLINNEGRAQHFYQVFVSSGEPRQSWQILHDLIETKNAKAVDWRVCEDVTRALAEANPAFNAIQETAPTYSWREPTGDPMRGEANGKRLWENGAGYLASFSPADPEAPLDSGEFWLTPRAAIFGSEELSRIAPGIASVIAASVIRLHPDDAAKLSVAEGDLLSFQIDATTYTLPAKLDEGVAKSAAIIPVGYPETAGIIGIRRARIEKSP